LINSFFRRFRVLMGLATYSTRPVNNATNSRQRSSVTNVNPNHPKTSILFQLLFSSSMRFSTNTPGLGRRATPLLPSRVLSRSIGNYRNKGFVWLTCSVPALFVTMAILWEWFWVGLAKWVTCFCSSDKRVSTNRSHSYLQTALPVLGLRQGWPANSRRRSKKNWPMVFIRL